jgi:anaerobic magnesium-protoporphyrin IX monomethyl ester cyclase
MKVILVFPPQFDPTIPNLALPCLTAVLRAAGHEVIQRDLNVESYDRLLSGAELERSFARIHAGYDTLQFLKPEIPAVKELARQKDRLIRGVEKAKRVWREPRDFYNYRRFTQGKLLLEEGLQFISLAYFRSRLSFTQYEMYYSPESAEQILRAVRDPSLNLYIDYFSRHAIPEFVEAAPQVVGISIACRSQVIPGLTLAYWLKQASPNIHIVIGGTHFTNLRDSLAQHHELFTLFDSVILYEGETAFTRLAGCLESGQSLRTVPNLIFKDGAAITASDGFHMEDIEELPTPCFDGLPLALYFSPRPVFMIYASRGCYWGRCAFCSHSDYSGNRYRLRSPQKVIADIETLIQKHGCYTFGLADLAVSPGVLARLAAGINQAGLPIHWFCMARLERKLDRQLCAALAKSGCKMLLFGLESGSDRVLSFMDKGIHADTISEVLAASHQAGIANFVSCIFGFPTETEDEARETIRMIRRNLPYIMAVTVQNFQLERNSKVYRNPGYYKVAEIISDARRDLAWECHYRTGEGLSPKEAAHLAGQVYQICKTSYPELFDMFLPYFLYIIHYRQDNRLWRKTHPLRENLPASASAQQRYTAAIQKKLGDLQ